MENKLVSVIVPVYNVEPYINKCIESIMNQTYQNIEIILVDDGSTDASGAICDEYAKKDGRIKTVHKKNEGLVKTRKVGFLYSKGEYICIIDSDDWVEKDMIQEMYDNIIITDADFVHTGTILEENGRITTDCRYEEQVVDNPRYNIKIWKELLGVGTDNYIHRGLARKFFRRDILENCYAHTSDYVAFGEDFITTARCLIECKRVSFIKKAYYHYCIRKGSITRTTGIERMYMAVLQYEELRKLFLEYGMYDFIQKWLEIACAKETMYVIKNYIRFNLPEYSVRNLDLIRDKKIIIYGAGKVGHSYYQEMRNHKDVNIVCMMDRMPSSYKDDDIRILGKERLSSLDFDYILIAVNSEKVADEICAELLEMGIDKNKLIWEKPLYIYDFIKK